MAHWIDLPVEDDARLHEGDVYRIRDERGEVHVVTYERSPGGGHAFYTDGGDPIDAAAVEVTR